jgi:16S rRNA (guanine966-N2)-methyltransferase
MRIIGGIAGGRLLKVPRGMSVRPTPDLVRQAVFNSLGDFVAGARVLELFAGTGALSLECLSRGAHRALCIEKSGRHAAFIRDNAQSTGLAGASLQVRIMDAFDAIRQQAAEGAQFDLVMADPPYGDKNINRGSESFAQKVLDDPGLPALIADGGMMLLGHASRDALEVPPGWMEAKVLKHGDNVFGMYRVTPVNAAPPSATIE